MIQKWDYEKCAAGMLFTDTLSLVQIIKALPKGENHGKRDSV